MPKVDFYKVNSKAKLTKIEASVDSLHSRRVLLIKDQASETIFICPGSAASSSTVKGGKKAASKIIEEQPTYNLETVDPDSVEEVVTNLLKGPSGTKPKSKSVPGIPKISGSPQPPETKKETEDGPIIKEFQIAYYVENTTDTGLEQEVNTLLEQYQQQIQSILAHKGSKSVASKKLNSITDKIIDTIYS